MALLVILIGIVVQRFVGFLSIDFHIAWFDRYYLWMVEKVEPVTKGHGVLSLTILVLPVLLIVGLCFAIAYHLTGIVGYFILSVIWFWYCIDARDTQKRPYTMQSPNILLDNAYRSVFGAIFWFAVFGPLGLTLYYIVACVCDELARLKDERIASTLTYAYRLQAVLDWLPERLLGLSFALVGHFTSVVKVWMKQSWSGLKSTRLIAQSCAQAALDHSDHNDEGKLKGMAHLLDRALLVWLMVVALVTMGILLG